MNSVEYVAQILKQEGVEWLSCYPANALIPAVAELGIRPVTFRHERGAVMAADGYSRVSDGDRFGVVVMQNQSGAENSSAGIAQAYADNVSILALPAGNSMDMLFVQPNFSAVQSWKSFVKSGEIITRKDQTGAVMRRAFQALRNGPGGPVVVEMPADVCGSPIPESAIPYTSPVTALSAPSRGDIDDAAKALVGAKNALIWAGAGVLRAEATEQLKELAELLEVPVFTTTPGKSAIDERHPLSVGAGSMTTTAPARQWLDTADVILAIGSSLTATPYAPTFESNKFLIHAVNDPRQINKDMAADVALLGDAKLTLEALIDTVKGLVGSKGRKTGMIEKVASARTAWNKRVKPYLTNNDAPLSPYRVVWEIDQTLDRENSIVTHDAGAPRDQVVPFYTATTPHSYIGWGKSTNLGLSIPLMIGAKMAKPDKFCLNVMGDGAFGMSGLDIETASRAGIPITTVLLNNGIMATYPRGQGVAQEKFGASLMQGDYAMIAQGMGAEAIRVAKPEELAPALVRSQQLNSEGKTVLIDVKTRAEHFRGPNRFGDLLGTVGNE